MSRKLIQAHEEERNWIARELHEHIERLCLLSIDLERFGNIEAARQQIEDLAADCQALSRRVHSAKLEYLGLDAAVASFCKELSDNKRIEIGFVCNGIRTTLPEEIAVSLYRVLQEALQNAASYSGELNTLVSLTVIRLSFRHLRARNFAARILFPSATSTKSSSNG
jgi:signal transduction histidine kinase